MRWVCKAPGCDQIMWKLGFALFPVKLSNETWIWLECYWQQYASYGNNYWCKKYKCTYDEITKEHAKEVNSKIKYVNV